MLPQMLVQPAVSSAKAAPPQRKRSTSPSTWATSGKTGPEWAALPRRARSWRLCEKLVVGGLHTSRLVMACTKRRRYLRLLHGESETVFCDGLAALVLGAVQHAEVTVVRGEVRDRGDL